MAKVNHNNHLNTIKELSDDGARKKVLHLSTEGEDYDGKTVNIEGKKYLNFGSCGYLGLETDQRLKNKACEYLQRYGMQFSVSRSYLTQNIVHELEANLRKMYGSPAIVYSSTTIGHISIIPSIIEHDDMIILDHQVHMCVQTAVQLMKAKGIAVDMIKHSNLEMLEARLREHSNKYERIWYMVDGVYSMYGDVAPIDELNQLMQKYPKLHLYIDDAHGMSWTGTNGCGYVWERVKDKSRFIYTSTMAKGFGCIGGFGIFYNEEFYHRVHNFGGPLGYSHALPPASLGASIASTEIHLTDEIYQLHDELRRRINLTNHLLKKADLPVVSNPYTPIYNIACGQPKAGYHLVKAMMNEGFFVNPAIFPTVPINRTGLRFTITRHQSLEDIQDLVGALAYHHPKALKAEGGDINKVRRFFGLPPVAKLDELATSEASKALSSVQQLFVEEETYQTNGSAKATIKATNELLKLEAAAYAINKRGAVSSHSFTSPRANLKVELYNDISQVDAGMWDSRMAKRGSFDTNALRHSQIILSGNAKKEDNAKFFYLIIKDETGEPVVMTYFTIGFYKDDLVAPASVSLQVEEKRKGNPHYLCSYYLATGSLLTEGEHVFINRAHPQWRQGTKLLLDQALQLAEANEVDNIMLRDFTPDEELRNLMLEEGFFKLDMPHSNVIKDMSWSNFEELREGASKRNRKNLGQEVERYLDRYEVEVKSKLTPEETDWYYQLYLEVKKRNYGVNYFDYPKKLFTQMSAVEGWEFVLIRLKPEYYDQEDDATLPVAVAACYKGDGHYSPTICGMNYKYAAEHKLYKQMVYRLLQRARDLGFSTAYLGVTADTEKRKLGAEQLPRVAYMQVKDMYNFEVLENLSVAVSSYKVEADEVLA